MNESSEEEQMNHLRPLIQELGQIFARAWQDDADAIGVIMDKLREEGFGVLFEVNVGLVRQEDLSAVEPKPVPQRRRRRLVKESGRDTSGSIQSRRRSVSQGREDRSDRHASRSQGKIQ